MKSTMCVAQLDKFANKLFISRTDFIRLYQLVRFVVGIVGGAGVVWGKKETLRRNLTRTLHRSLTSENFGEHRPTNYWRERNYPRNWGGSHQGLSPSVVCSLKFSHKHCEVHVTSFVSYTECLPENQHGLPVKFVLCHTNALCCLLHAHYSIASTSHGNQVLLKSCQFDL